MNIELDRVVYQNERFYVEHCAKLSSFIVLRHGSHEIVRWFDYSFLTFPILRWAKKAKAKAIRFADELNKLSKPERLDV